MSGVRTAKAGNSVILTANPSSNAYLLKDVNVVYANNESVAVSGGWFTNAKASFTMPMADVIVTPSFTDDWTAEGGLYINMPKTGTIDANIPAGVQSFKVYDDGGMSGNYSINSNGKLVLTAPSGYVLQLTGLMRTGDTTRQSQLVSLNPTTYKFVYTCSADDYLEVYNGSNTSASNLVQKVTSSCDETYGPQLTSVNRVLSSGNTMTLLFKSGELRPTTFGLDLLVKLIPVSNRIAYVNENSGGTVTSSSPKTGNIGSIVNYTYSYSSGYLVSEIKVEAENGDAVEVSGGWYSNKEASFKMPPSNVTVKSTYTNDLTAAGGLYINMPKTGTIDATIPAGVQSFSVYDDGGKSGNYSVNSNGKLVLTAPSGYVLQLTGLMRTGDTTRQSQLVSLNPTTYKFVYTCSADDYLEVYDGSNTSASNLVQKVTSSCDETYGPQLTSVNRVLSSGNAMTLLFKSGELRPTTFGLDLLVKLIPVSNRIAYVNENSGGTVTSSSPKTGNIGSIVNYTYSYSSGYLVSEIKVEAENGDAVEVSGGWYSNKEASFKMPPSNVTVKSTYTNDLTAAGGLYINMPKTGTIDATIPDGVKWFDVFDDGGKASDFSPNSDGLLALTAPSGYVLQLTGLIKTGHEKTAIGIYSCNVGSYLSVYDGLNTTASKLLDGKISDCNDSFGSQWTSIGKIISSGNTMLLRFVTGKDGSTSDGLDLRVALIKLTLDLKDDDGTKYVNMVYKHKATLTIPDTVKEFHVYDEGGKKGNYNGSNNDTLVLTAPPDCVLELTGLIKTGDTTKYNKLVTVNPVVYEESYSCKREDYLEVYDGTNVADSNLLQKITSKCSEISGPQSEYLQKNRSSGRSLTLYFKASEGENTTSGLDLTVKVKSTKHTITFKTVANGIVKSDKASANAGEKVTLTAYPSLNCMMSSISVKDSASDKEIDVTGGWYSGNKMTFTMPENGVIVTPRFTTDLSAEGGLYINMQPGKTVVNVSKTVKSFYVYDNGGKDKNYRDYSNDTLVLEVPAGYRMRLTGTMVAENRWDVLRVYDGENTEATQLFGASAFVSGAVTDIGDTVVSSGASMTITFNSDDGKNYDGYALKVTVELAHYAVTVKPAPGGEVYVMGGDTLGAGVLLFASGTGSNRLSGIQVTDKNGNLVKAPIYDFDRSTFTMPQGGVTVIPTFTSDLTAEGGLHLDMVKDGYEIANIPEGVRSFKLYDNGGANGNYENNSSDILTITAPEGYRLNVTGSINVESGHYDSLYIFDGTTIGADTLFSGTCSGSSAYDIGSIRSKGRSLTFHFKSDGNGVRSGLDLTVKVLKPVHLLTIADIPQQSYTGDSIKPTPIIKDGARTLVENTDYTLSYSSNTNSGEASVTIRGMGEYIGSTTLTFTIGPKVTKYAAIKILEDQRGMGVAVDGNYNGDEAVMITDSIEVDYVDYSRKFSTSGFSTIVLPFDVSTSNVSGLKKVAAFSEIKTNDAGRLVAVMSLVWKDSVGVPDTTLKANTPYMVLMNDGKFAVDGGVTLVPTVEPVVRSGTWEFRGTLAKRVWADGDSDLGHVYGFAAEERPDQNIKIGQFVKAAAGAWIRPGRAYLINVPEEQGNHVGAGRPAIAALPSVFLPEEMDVVIEDKENGSTTFVGRFNARTGKFVNMKARTYDLKGRNVKGHKAKGMFIRK